MQGPWRQIPQNPTLALLMSTCTVFSINLVLVLRFLFSRRFTVSAAGKLGSGVFWAKSYVGVSQKFSNPLVLPAVRNSYVRSGISYNRGGCTVRKCGEPASWRCLESRQMITSLADLSCSLCHKKFKLGVSKIGGTFL